MIHFRPLLHVLTLLVAVTLMAPAVAAQDGPSHIVTAFHDTLLEVMKQAETLGTQGRYKKLAGRIEETFHLGLMARISSGSYWRKASAGEIEKLITAFSRLSISTYASQFDGWSGQSFETQGQKPGPQETILVKTRIIDPGSDPIDLTYVTREIKGQWRIIDVLLDTGISQLAVRRSEYSRILKTGGIDALTRILDAKADQLLKE